MKGAIEEITKAPSDELDVQDKTCASDVRELSNDIEDSIEPFMVQCTGSEPSRALGFKAFIVRSVDLLTRFDIRQRIAAVLRDIKWRVIEASERRERYRIDGVVAKLASADRRLLAHYTKARELVGIGDKTDELIKMLTEGQKGTKCPSRKTALANVVYEKYKRTI